MSPTTNLTILALASLGAPAPLRPSHNTCSSSRFTLRMRTYAQNYTLSGIDTGKAGELAVVALDQTGTPFCATGVNPNKTLELAILPDDDAATDQFGTFHIYVPSLGETYGNQVPIIARKEGFEWPHFTIGDGADGGVYPQMTAASQTWYACDAHYLGKHYIGLSWGVYNSNGSAPWECTFASVSKVYDLPGDC